MGAALVTHMARAVTLTNSNLMKEKRASHFGVRPVFSFFNGDSRNYGQGLSLSRSRISFSRAISAESAAGAMNAPPPPHSSGSLRQE